MAPRISHCIQVRSALVRSQYQRKSATAKAECACAHEGLKYMYTGRELPNQMPKAPRNAHVSSQYFFANRKEIQIARKPYKAVLRAIAIRYGDETPSAEIWDPKR